MRFITITGRKRAGVLAWMFTWTGQCQRELSDRVHAAADKRAHQHGWEVTKSTGRFGFGARSYRDPRFDDRREATPVIGLDDLVLGTDQRDQLVRVPLRSPPTYGPTGSGAPATGAEE